MRDLLVKSNRYCREQREKLQQQLHGSPQVRQAAKDKGTKKQALPNGKQAALRNSTADGEAARKAEAAAAAAAAELLMEEEKEQQAQLQKANKAAAKRAKALQKKARLKITQDQAAQRAAAAAAADLLLQQEKEHQAQLQKAGKAAAKGLKAQQKKAGLNVIPSTDEASNAEQEAAGRPVKQWHVSLPGVRIQMSRWTSSLHCS